MEKYGPKDDPVLNRFRSLRTDLSRMSWNCFVENSVVGPAAVSAKARRPTIELDLQPARETSLEPF